MRKEIPAVAPSIAIGSRFLVKFSESTPSAWLGSLTISAREISSTPTASGLDIMPMPTYVVVVPISPSPVRNPQGDVPAVFFVMMWAYVYASNAFRKLHDFRLRVVFFLRLAAIR